MTDTQPIPPDFDPDGPAGESDGIFGVGTPLEAARVVVIPVPFEATVSYGSGTSGGPAAVLAASRQVDLFDAQTGKPYEHGIAMLPVHEEILKWSADGRRLAQEVVAAGGVLDDAMRQVAETVDAFGQGLNIWVRERVRDLLARNRVAVVLGGDHSVPYGAIEAYAERFPGIGILHVDAHYDLRVAYEGFNWSHASIMHNVLERLPAVGKVVHVGVRDFCEAEVRASEAFGDRSVAYDEFRMRDTLADGRPWRKLADEIVSHLPETVYVSFDIDGLDPSLCPGTGTPVPGGLSFYEATSLLDAVVRSGRRIVGADLCEVAPQDGDGEWNANVGARMLYKLIGFALKSMAT